MTKVRFHGPVAAFSGAMGEMVFADQGKRTVAYMKPHHTPSESQLAWQDRFSEATAYAKRAQADPAKWELYETVAKEKDIPAFSLAVADYLNMPYFKYVDFENYKGRVGDPILIGSVDDLGLVSVEVEMNMNDGTDIEKGQAVEIGTRTNNWVYTATAPVALGTKIFVKFVGYDHVGKQALKNAYITVGVDEE